MTQKYFKRVFIAPAIPRETAKATGKDVTLEAAE
jgi:hypothetical protein